MRQAVLDFLDRNARNAALIGHRVNVPNLDERLVGLLPKDVAQPVPRTSWVGCGFTTASPHGGVCAGFAPRLAATRSAIHFSISSSSQALARGPILTGAGNSLRATLA